jgi:RimJ/RimL family protein N-acetyltransferase
MEIPTLETARLRLVPPRPAHFEAYAALLADPLFVAHLELKPLSRNEADRSFCALVGHWHLRKCGNFIVEERGGGPMVGRVGINEWEGWPEPELGWWTVPAAWGRGYAPEAAAAVLELARRDPRRQRLVSFIRPSNARSIRVAEKLGARRALDIDFLGGPTQVHVHRLRSGPAASIAASSI